MTARKVLAILAVSALMAAACGDDDVLTSTQPPTSAPPATVATTDAPPTTPAPTTQPPTTVTTTTTIVTTTSTSTTTTTVPAFTGTTDGKQANMVGSPNGHLIDVLTGKHPGFTRVVWETDGDLGTPMYMVGYANPPFVIIGGFTIPVNGSAFIHVILFPAMRYDITDPSNIFLTYLGSETITVHQGSVQQVVFVEDFEANMEWVIGLTGQKPFNVFTMENPTRLVIDIAD